MGRVNDQILPLCHLPTRNPHKEAYLLIEAIDNQKTHLKSPPVQAIEQHSERLMLRNSGARSLCLTAFPRYSWHKSLTMPRKLKHHEQKLLRKVDFITWKQDNDHRDAAVRRRYMIQKPEG